jgi:hypothetical protein
MKWAYCFLLLFLTACSGDEPSVKQPVAKDTAQRSTIPVRQATTNPYSPVDMSPMDITHYPVDYPKLKQSVATKELLSARVIYSRPQRQGRKIFGNLVKYGEPWRLGANEATEIEFFKSATIQGKRINKGRYILYCIPQEAEWTLVLNSNTDRWGLHPDPSKDVARFTIPVQKDNPPVEHFTMTFVQLNRGAELLMAWDDVVARLPIQF